MRASVRVLLRFISSRPLLRWGMMAGLLAAGPLAAQWSFDEHPLQVHGFATQGFAYSSGNDYLSMRSQSGSFAFTDAGLNVSAQLTSRFRVGAQAYVRDIGRLGRGRVSLDWALGDYRVADWLGFRAGKVKTVLGLYNDTQDVEVLHTWALLPQSVYPIDLRSNSLAHLGGDVYGKVKLPHLGDFSYTAYAGTLSIDRVGGYALGLQAVGLNPNTLSGHAEGGDLRWETPLQGLLVGGSFISAPKGTTGTNELFSAPFHFNDYQDRRTVLYGQYTHNNLRVEGEWSRQIEHFQLFGAFGPSGPAVDFSVDHRAWYTALVYRVSKHLELGTYHSRFFPNSGAELSFGMPLPPAARHIIDQAVTARVDLRRYWDVKVEMHFMDGYGDPASFQGFYPQADGDAFKPKTNLLLVRTGVNF